MNLRYLMVVIAVALSVLTISGCQSGPNYDNRPMDGGGYGSDGGNSGY
ncbi:hypothetical protein [Pararhizobium sp. A13]